MNNQKKKVLLVITKSNFGGAQKYVYELAQGLITKGFEMRVVLGGDGVLVQKLKDSNIDTIQVPYLGRDISLLQDIKTFFMLIAQIRKFKPQVLHVNSSKIGGIGALAGRLCFVPDIVFTIHGWAFNENRSPLSKFLIKCLYSITLILSKKSIAVSDAIKNQARTLPFYFLFKRKIYTVHNGIKTPDFLSKEDSRKFLSSKIGVDLQDKTIIGQIAELHPIKSIETTIAGASELVKKFPHIVFLIMGEGEERKKLEQLISEHNLSQNVFLLGFVDNAAQYTKAFDIFCLTSKSEALALVLIEAGLAQVPVLASRVGGIPELITENQTGFLFESQNVNEFKNQIEHILSLSIDEKNKITEAFYTKIQSHFLVEHMTTKTIDVYTI